MTRRFYWGIATLIILLIGVSVFLLTRTPDTEPPEEVYRPLTPAEKEQVDRNIQEIIDKAKKNQPQVAEIEHQEIPHKNLQQNNSVGTVNDSAETVTVENYLEGINEIDLFESVTIPTDAQLANYTRAEAVGLYKKLFEATETAHIMQKKYIKQREALREALSDIATDISRQAEAIQLRQQAYTLDRIIENLIEQQNQLFQEKTRANNHQRSLR